MLDKTLDYFWKIENSNGQVLLDQAEDKSLKEINDLPKPYFFILYPNPEKPKSDQKKTRRQLLDGDKRWVYFRRIYKRVDKLGDHFIKCLYCYGYQKTDNGRNVKILKWFDPVTGEDVPEDVIK